ncbi:unnamed protein product, partial [Medioppia subpectinata]
TMYSCRFCSKRFDTIDKVKTHFLKRHSNTLDKSMKKESDLNDEQSEGLQNESNEEQMNEELVDDSVIEGEENVEANDTQELNDTNEENEDEEKSEDNKKTTIVIKQQRNPNRVNKSKVKMIETERSIQTRNRIKRELPNNLELKIVRPDASAIELPPKRGRPKKYELRQVLTPQLKNATRRYPCPFEGCEYVAKYRSNLWDHKKLHTGEKPYRCNWPSCEMRFPQSQQLKLHLRSHTGEKPYACDWPGCEWKFRLKGALTDHKKAVHEGVKAFTCEWPGCNKKFLQSCHLRKHMMAHADIKPFVCDWPNCTYKAVSMSYVTNHKKTHTGEKNFECGYNGCTKRFVKSSHVNRHQQKCHPEMMGQTIIDDNDDVEISARNEWKTFYDYIVIGAGTAGSVVAARLSEDPKVSVLLIEAGGSETVVSNTPALSDSLLNTVMDWKFMSTPQNQSCLSMNGQMCVLSSGRVIGGTSAINRMTYLRGNPLDFDNWEKLGVKGWSWRDVFPFFIRAENQSDAQLSKSGYYGVNGPLVINNNHEYNQLLQSWIFSSHLCGHKISDLNADYLGASVLQTNTNEGRRVSTATAYLEPNIERPNLHILANALVTQILFENNTAIGVNFIRNWHNFAVYAKQEVILSTGTINSAKLLMLSGIGPKDHLEELNIPVISDLPVGNNFHDHIGTYGLHFTVNTTIEEPLTVQSLNQYFNSGKGPLSQSRFAATLLQSKYTNISTEWPDIMLMTSTTSPGRENSGETTEQRNGFKKEVWTQFYGPYSGLAQFTVWPILLRPKSRGWVRLNSPNPSDQPLINPNYLTESSDILVLMEGMKETLKIANSRPLQSLMPIPFVTLVPGCEPYLMNNQSLEAKDTLNTTFFTDPYLQCMARSLTVSTGDYVGTCRMGSDEDRNKVVDSRLKVMGVNNLRVIDASVIPVIPTANTNAVTVMIAERGSHFIKFDYRYKNLILF